jgi:hypothetical protein
MVMTHSPHCTGNGMPLRGTYTVIRRDRPRSIESTPVLLGDDSAGWHR